MPPGGGPGRIAAPVLARFVVTRQTGTTMIEIIKQNRVTIRRISVGPLDNNVHLLTHRTDGSQLLIDAATDIDAIEELIASAGEDAAVPTSLGWLVTTHSHADHIGALADLRARYPLALTAAGARDAAAITAATGVAIDRHLDHDDQLGLGDLNLTVIALRGHTPGSIALAHTEDGYPTQVFTGDSLFPGGVGNTWGDPARFQSLFSDVVSRVFEVFRPSAVIHPGHGDSTTLGAEQPNLQEWARRGW